MSSAPVLPNRQSSTNVQQAVPFFMVQNMEKSLLFYLDGLGFEMTKKWIDEGKLRWCWLKIGEAAIMLQEYGPAKAGHEPPPTEKHGVGVSVCFQCQDALAIYRELRNRDIQVKRPFVGNSMWVTSVVDPDGYKLDFESVTDAPEESVLEE